MAAAVLAQETGMAADTLDKLLYEHGTGHPGAEFRLPTGTTVIVDEAGMVPTPKLAALARLADRYHWRVVLVGDPRQLSPVGRGGMFAHLTASGPVIELDRVHRFAQPWERKASLQIRRGDPDGIAAYHAHGRIHDTLTARDARRQALTAWATARNQGRKVALLAATSETVDWLNHAAQQQRIAAGELDPDRFTTTGAGQRLHERDRVVTRRNDRRLRTDRKMMVKNRASWTVTALHPDGSITVRGADGNIVLPAGYVHDQVELGYAETVHAAQGRTVDFCILVVDGAIDSRAVYVGLTRGRDGNFVYVLATEQRTGAEILGDAIMRDWTDTPAIDIRAELAERLGRVDPLLIGRGDLGQVTDLILTPDALQELVAHRHQLRRLGVDTHLHRHQQLQDEQTADRKALAVGHRQRHRTLRSLNDALEHRQQLGPFQRSERRQVDQDISEAENELRHIGAQLEKLRERLDRRRPELDVETGWLRDHCGDVDRYHQVNRRLAQDVTARAQAVAPRPPAHLLRLVGPRPKTAGKAQQAWDRAVGHFQQHCVAYQITDPTEVLGPSSRWLSDDDRTRDAALVRLACRAAHELNPARMAHITPAGACRLDELARRPGPSLGR